MKSDSPGRKQLNQKQKVLREGVLVQLDQTLELLRQAKQSAQSGADRVDVLDRISQARGKLRQAVSRMAQMQLFEELYGIPGQTEEKTR